MKLCSSQKPRGSGFVYQRLWQTVQQVETEKIEELNPRLTQTITEEDLFTAETQRTQNYLCDLRALRGDRLFDHEGREVHEGRDTNENAEGAERNQRSVVRGQLREIHCCLSGDDDKQQLVYCRQ